MDASPSVGVLESICQNENCWHMQVRDGFQAVLVRALDSREVVTGLETRCFVTALQKDSLAVLPGNRSEESHFVWSMSASEWRIPVIARPVRK